MRDDALNQKASFCLLPAFTAGIYDGMNPCNFASALIFLIYIALVGYTQRRVLWFGFLFILSAGLTHFALSFGLFDMILSLPVVLNGFLISYGIMAVVFLTLGLLNISDWWQYKQHEDIERFRCQLPCFLTDLQSRKSVGIVKQAFINIGLVLLTLIIAFAVTLAGAIYPQQEYIFIVHSYLMAGGDVSFVVWSFFQYGLASMLSLMVIWSVIFLAGFKGRGNKRVIAYYKGISAALFFGVGIGLGFFLLS